MPSGRRDLLPRNAAEIVEILQHTTDAQRRRLGTNARNRILAPSPGKQNTIRRINSQPCLQIICTKNTKRLQRVDIGTVIIVAPQAVYQRSACRVAVVVDKDGRIAERRDPHRTSIG